MKFCPVPVEITSKKSVVVFGLMLWPAVRETSADGRQGPPLLQIVVVEARICRPPAVVLGAEGVKLQLELSVARAGGTRKAAERTALVGGGFIVVVVFLGCWRIRRERCL